MPAVLSNAREQFMRARHLLQHRAHLPLQQVGWCPLLSFPAKCMYFRMRTDAGHLLFDWHI